MKKKAKSSKDESNHHLTEQESLSVQERFVRTDISLALTKNGGSMPIGLGSRSFPVVWLAGR